MTENQGYLSCAGGATTTVPTTTARNRSGFRKFQLGILFDAYLHFSRSCWSGNRHLQLNRLLYFKRDKQRRYDYRLSTGSHQHHFRHPLSFWGGWHFLMLRVKWLKIHLPVDLLVNRNNMFDLKEFKKGNWPNCRRKKHQFGKILEAMESAIAAAYRKEYGKKGEAIKAKLDLKTGDLNFWQLKTVVDANSVRLKERRK